MRERRREFLRLAFASGAVALLLAIVSAVGAVAAVATITTAGSGRTAISPMGKTRLIETRRTLSSSQATVRNGPWIAFATTPPYAVYHQKEISHPWGAGGDVFVARVGGRPKLVAGRGLQNKYKTWNVCPAFSPDGRMLAIAQVVLGLHPRSTIMVVRIGPGGPMRAGRLVMKLQAGAVHCPRWSANSSRLAYLNRGQIVIRGLDGLKRHRAKGDPTIGDFYKSHTKVVSWTRLTATLGPGDVITVSRPDGTTRNTIPDNGSYAIAGWSPDGRDLLLMKDVCGCGYQLRAVSVDPPFVSRIVVPFVQVNGGRSWPSYGDVSWQPIP